MITRENNARCHCRYTVQYVIIYFFTSTILINNIHNTSIPRIIAYIIIVVIYIIIHGHVKLFFIYNPYYRRTTRPEPDDDHEGFIFLFNFLAKCHCKTIIIDDRVLWTARVYTI